MSLLLLLTLLSSSPSVEKVPDICVDLTAILGEAVEEGYLSIKEAGDVIARCARGGGFWPLLPLNWIPMKLSKLPKLLTKAEQCTSRKEAKKILKKASKLTKKITIVNEWTLSGPTIQSSSLPSVSWGYWVHSLYLHIASVETELVEETTNNAFIRILRCHND